MNEEIIGQFKILQRYNTFIGEKGKSIGYTKIINVLKSIPFEIQDTKKLKSIKGIGDKAILKIDEFIKTGKIEAVESAKKEMRGTSDIEEVWGIGTITAKKLVSQGIKNLDDLRSHPEVLNRNQKIGLEYHEQLQQRIPRDYITVLYVIILILINRVYDPDSYKICVTGSYRRGMASSGDIDCLITSDVANLRKIVDILKDSGVIREVLSIREQKFMGIACCPGNQDRFVRLDIQFIPKESWGFALVYFTGSKEFNIIMRARANSLGLTLNEHGLFSGKTKVYDSLSEREIFQVLGMQYLEPPEREPKNIRYITQ